MGRLNEHFNKRRDSYLTGGDGSRGERMTEKIAVDSKWEKTWADMMIEIWREKIRRMKITDTYALMQEMSNKVSISSSSLTIQHKFMEYGVYQDIGVGYGYSLLNKGDQVGLKFLDKDYRHDNGLDKPKKVGPAWGGGYTSGKPRSKRNWMSKRYYASIMVLKDYEAFKYGDAFCGIISNILQESSNINRKL